jgi:para-aminobenzoate synthetase component 1
MKTMKIIQCAEQEERGYYTGVVGVFNGTNLDSAVMIRFIEMRDGKLFYRSGGGITAMSNAREEYDELLDKIYVPIT